MLRFLIFLSLISSISASSLVMFPSPISGHEVKSIGIKNTFNYQIASSRGIIRNITINCHLFPDNVSCNYVPVSFICENKKCWGTSLPNTRVSHVEITGESIILEAPLKIAWFSYDVVENMIVKYTLVRCDGCEFCDPRNFDLYQNGSSYIMMLIVGTLIVFLIKGPEIIVLVIFEIFIVMISYYSVSTCAEPFPLN